MAADFAPMLLAIEEVALGAGTVRVVTSPPRLGAYPASPAQEAMRSVAGPRVEAFISEKLGAKAAFYEMASIKALDVEVTLRMEWTVMAHELDAVQRRTLRAEAWTLEDAIRAALQRPGNLAMTSLLVPTRIRSGCLRVYSGARLEREDWPRKRFSIIARYRADFDPAMETA